MTEEHKTSSSQPEDVLYLQYVYLKLMRLNSERKLVDHRASENLMDCLKK